MSLDDARIGFIGGGAMAEALVGGLLAADVPAAQLRVGEPSAERRAHLGRALGVETHADNAAVVAASNVVVIAVKPDAVAAALGALPTRAGPGPLWISIAAGVTLARLEAALGAGARVVRAMPNTPAQVGAGATGFCANASAGAPDQATARALFECVGWAWQASEEAQLDAVTALSGSGPAYVFLLLEALEAAGVAVGLPRETALRLALETCYGAALLARQADVHPAELRARVSSPGGTTLAALERLEARGFRAAVAEAVAAATRRARELAG